MTKPSSPDTPTGRISPHRRLTTQSITMIDVARIAGVSAQTVSRVLRTPETVSPERRERVMAAIRETNYVHNAVASNLASSRSHTVAAIIPLISNSIFAGTVQGLTQELLPFGYQVIIGITEYDSAKEEDIVRSILGRRPHGIFLIGTHHSSMTRQLLENSGIPVVESWDWVTNPIDSLVGFSNRQALIDLQAHLAQAGYRNPVFCGVVTDGDKRAEERLKGFNHGLKKFFGHTSKRQVILHEPVYTMAMGRTFLHEARTRYPDADVLVFTSDVFATGALFEAQREGLRVPQDIAITGFGGYDFAGETNPSLTTVTLPVTEIGARAARLILQGTEGKRGCRIKVNFKLAPGGST
ncbi:LacI family transcriptional regulator OS=Castellaniella defragrans OX=75697 GN=HNR28_000959 PE=4 SV=1 [Castellaniella defragrans]